MIRGLRGTFSRTAVICGLAFALAEILVVFTRTSWIGFFGYTPEWANAGLYVATPLIAGAAAFVSRDYFSAEVVAITRARTVRGAAGAVVTAWLRIAGIGLAAHGAVMLLALGVSAGFGPSGALRWEPFALAPLPIVMACAIGTALAALLPHLWSSVLAAIVTYGIWYLAVTTDAVTPVNIGGATISLAGLAYRPEFVGLSLGASLIVTAAFLAVAALAVRRQSFAGAVSAFAIVAVGIVVGGAMLGARLDLNRFGPAQSVDSVCAGTAPQVCLSVDHSARVQEVAAHTDSAARLLTRIGVDLSDVVLREESGAEGPTQDGILLLTFGQLNGIGTDERDYAHALLRPANCTEYYQPEMTPPLERLLTAAQLVGTWMESPRTESETTLTDDEVRHLYDGLMACSVDEQTLDDARLP